MNGKKRGRPPKTKDASGPGGNGAAILPPPKPTVYQPSGMRWAGDTDVEAFLEKFHLSPAARSLLHPRLHPLGNGISLHSHYHEVVASSVSVEEFSEIFARVSIGEYKEGCPMFSISIFHGSARDISDPMEYFPTRYPDMHCKVGHASFR